MKWGVRRARTTTNTSSGGRKKKSTNPIVTSFKKRRRAKQLAQRKEAAAKARTEAAKKKPTELTDKELKERVARLELEKKYVDLMRQTNPPKNAKGKKFVDDVVTDVLLNNIGKQTAALLAGTLVNKGLEILSDEKEFRINPRKGQKDK